MLFKLMYYVYIEESFVMATTYYFGFCSKVGRVGEVLLELARFGDVVVRIILNIKLLNLYFFIKEINSKYHVKWNTVL